MVTEHSRIDAELKIQKLEMRLLHLEEEQKQDHELIARLERELRETATKLNRAEIWGRSILWAGIAVGGLATQVSDIMAWVKK